VALLRKFCKKSRKSRLCQGTTLQAAEKLILGCKKCQGTTLHAAEKLILGCKKCQGTTSVVPQMQQNENGL